MVELIYPSSCAPSVPPATSFAGVREEILPVVEPSGVVRGRTLRSYVHDGSKVLHPVVHLHLINRYGEIFLQKRSMSKKLLPGRWDTAVGGHVSYGESLQEALYREASEELGAFEFNPIYLGNYVFESDIEREFVSIFAAVGNFQLNPVNEEVDEGRWWSEKEIAKATGKNILTPNFESEYLRIGAALQALL